MRYFKHFVWLFILLISACRSYQPQSLEGKYVAIKAAQPDSSIVALIAPYKLQLDQEMQVQVGTLDQDLVKAMPGSSLGNMMADILWVSAPVVNGKKPDFAVTNLGGIRTSSLNKGVLKRADAYQLMPFDNTIVSMKVNGATVLKLFQHMAQWGGWPISGATLYIDSAKSVQTVYIGTEKLDTNQTYTMATTDYVANGGDQCSFLKEINSTTEGTVYRTAILNYWNQYYIQGKSVPTDTIARVKYVQ